MSPGRASKMTVSARFSLWAERAARIPQKVQRKIMFSLIRTFPSEPPVYIRLLYKLINVINRPGRIAWESVFCTETVSNWMRGRGERKREKEREREGEREREISTFFLLYCSFPHPHLPTLSSVLQSVLKGLAAPQSARIRQNSRGSAFYSLYRYLDDWTGTEPGSSH